MREARLSAAQTSQRSVIWNGVRHISRPEDIFGAFDILVLPKSGCMALIQLTTRTGGGGPAARRNKIQGWVMHRFGEVGKQAAQPYLLARAPRRHFRIWEWRWIGGEWMKKPPESLPLLARPSPPALQQSSHHPGPPPPSL